VFLLHEKPVFSLSFQSELEEKYSGLGYHYDIEGHFDDCDCILQGVIKAELYVLEYPVLDIERVWEPVKFRIISEV